MFGEPDDILGRARKRRLLLLDAVSRDLPAARELHRKLYSERERRSALEVLDDPVVMRGIGDLWDAKRYGRTPPPESEELFSAILRHLCNATPDLPVTAGCSVRLRPGPSAPSIAVWDPDFPESIVKRCFESAVPDLTSGRLPGQRRRMALRRPEPAVVHSIEQGYRLLALVLPELSASVLAHVRLIGIFDDDASSSMSTAATPSTIFLNGGAHQRTPWRMAELLLHEAAHRKLMDMLVARRIHQRPARHGHGSSRIRAVWRRNASWSVRRTLGAFHVYVHLALFFAQVECLGKRLASEFGPRRVSSARALETALYRADYLGRALTAHALGRLGSDGRSLLAWLLEVPLRLGNADREIAAMLDRIRSSRPAIVTT